MIQQHSFWEIRDGRKARFQMDSWNQRARLSNIFQPPHTEDWETQQEETVNQHWTSNLNQGYRQWLNAAQIIRQGTEEIYNELDTELMNRNIQFSDKKDILRWGYTPRGTFSRKEACNLLIGHQDKKTHYGRKSGPRLYDPKSQCFYGYYVKKGFSFGTI